MVFDHSRKLSERSFYDENVVLKKHPLKPLLEVGYLA
jgi:hypothetical protein